MSQQTNNQTNVCAICLANAQARGGEFLCSPGCCGKWFHQSCIEDMKKAGKNFCPCCMKPFPALPTPAVAAAHPVPAQPVAPTPLQAFPVQQQQQQQFLPPPVQAVPFGNVMQNNPFAFPFQQQQQMPMNFAPPPAPVPSTATGIFARRQAAPTPAIPNRLVDDEIDTAEELLKKSSEKQHEKASSSSAMEVDQTPLRVSLTPEYTEETLAAKIPFHVRVSAVFQTSAVAEQEKTPLDVVCILDNSGSMSGSKIDNLKRAMEFVVSTLTEKDRLSIVTFNSAPNMEQGLWKMNEGRKTTSKEIVRGIVAGGGTDIYRGMQQGWQVLTNRKTKNPASCMFLLTDGQDGSYLEEKKTLARTMRAQGTSLFIFGFGNDHDANHLIQISNAAEGSFIYVETNDTVIDAFGGAIGTQQGQLLRDIQLQVNSVAANISIQRILAGSYLSNLSTDQRTGSVSFADLYGGEKRDFLLQLSLPVVTIEDDQYPLITVSGTYKQYGSDAIHYLTPTQCTIRRLATENYLLLPAHERDLEVDVQIQRLDYTKAMQEAMAEADNNRFPGAKAILAKLKTQLLESISYKKQNSFTLGLLEDLADCERKITSRESYESGGGRALMNESSDVYSKQRACYSKASRNMMQMQSATSSAQQTRATASKFSK
jgi:Mg-chelatase subunit ChlD